MSEAELRQVAEMVKHCSHRDGIGMGWQEVERALNGAAAELAALREKCERLEGDTNDAEAMLEFLQKENSRLRTQDDYRRAETYREGLEEIQGSCEAYPESVFPEMESDDWTRVRFIVENAGYTLDRLSASYLRMHKRHHLCIARETLEKGEKSADSETRCTCGHKRIGHYDNGACSGKNSGECNCTNFEEKK